MRRARGEHVIVATGTASGKTLAFNLPVSTQSPATRRSRALYLYPTKALAQDQFRTLRLAVAPGVRGFDSGCGPPRLVFATVLSFFVFTRSFIIF